MQMNKVRPFHGRTTFPRNEFTRFISQFMLCIRVKLFASALSSRGIEDHFLHQT